MSKAGDYGKGPTQVVQRRTQTRGLQTSHLLIRVTAGPDAGREQILDVEPVRMGSMEGCDFVLRDSTVSGVHLEVKRTALGLMLRDLGSTNGTYVNGLRAEAVYLDASSKLQLGNSTLDIEILGEKSAVELSKEASFGELVGESDVSRAVFARLKKLAATDSTVLLTGETGTGKELAAAAIQAASSRRDGPLVVVDCATLSAELIASELLGHERGAFTGAIASRAGAFERADGGTIFLDEIGELPLALQPTLLGVLERRQVQRVGGHKVVPTNVRVIAATNRELSKEVARGAFRSDLYYRLAVAELRLPPLRERREDIPVLVRHFSARLGTESHTIPDELMQKLVDYPWPGNVRELKNVVEKILLLHDKPELEGEPTSVPPTGATVSVDVEQPFREQKRVVVTAFETTYLTRLLETTGGNIAAAARKSGVDRMYLYKLLEKYGIEKRVHAASKP